MPGTDLDRSLLVIDDDRNVHLLIDHMLKDIVDETIHGYGAEQSLELAINKSPHCIILDLYLRDDLGLKLLRDLKHDARTAFIPVLMISSDDSCNRLASAYDSDAFGYLTKPINQVVLQAKVRAAFREYNLIHSLMMQCHLPD